MMRNMINLIKTLFTTWQGWSEIIIPACGAIVIPLLILWLTWFLGSYRAEKMAEKKRRQTNLSAFLIHLRHKRFLLFRNKIMFKRKYLKKL